MIWLTVSLLSPRLALADGRAATESLFLDGRRLMEAEQYAEACQRFEDSQRLDPAAGTALNLARCYALIERTASAWSLYREAAALASAANQREREQAALQAAAALEPKLARLILKQDEPQRELSIELDGSRAPSSMFVVATPVDPTPHEVVVFRKDKELWRTTVFATPGQVVEVSIPHFEPEPPAPLASGLRQAASVPATDRNRSPLAAMGTRRIAAVGLAATSLLAIGYAAVEALRARSAYQDSEKGCDADDNCTAVALGRRELAFDRARRADISLVFAGGAALGAGVLWFTVGTPKTSGRASVRAAPPFQVSWQARF